VTVVLPRRRAAAVFLVSACLAAAGGTAAAECGAPLRSPARCAQIAAAEALLAGGQAGEALLAFEQITALEHATDIELGLLRSQLQAGQFRRALAFAAHTAGAHGSDAGGAALYVWLLHLSGQQAFGTRVLRQARARLPADALLADVERRLAAGAATASGALLVAPTRFAPYASGDQPAGAVALVASGLLIDQGRRALVPARSVRGAERIWARDGLGRTVEARLARDGSASTSFVVLDLLRPLAAPDDPAFDTVLIDAFPGSPASVATYADAADAGPAWPWLHIGFLGPVDADGSRRLGIALPAHTLPGAPVFDRFGRVVGLALAGASGEHRLLPVAQIRAGRAATPNPPAVASAHLPADELYERALNVTLQVLVVGGDPRQRWEALAPGSSSP
jgi:hypothetical protein